MFHRRVIITIAFAAHATPHVSCGQERLVVAARVLTATLTMVQHRLHGLTLQQCHAQRVEHEAAR
jgi:hypothetical protein